MRVSESYDPSVSYGPLSYEEPPSARLLRGGGPPAPWMDETAADVLAKPSIADCVPNSFQRNLIRLYLEGETMLAVWGGVGCGKSVGLAMLAKVVAELRPGARILIVMRTYKDLMRIAYRNLRSALGPAWTYNVSRRVWSHPNESEIELAYYDLKSTQDEGQNPIDGADCHLVIVDEANKYADDLVFKHCNDRVRSWATDLMGNLHPPGLVVNGRPSGIPWWPRAMQDLLDKAEEQAREKGKPCEVRGRVLHVKSYSNAMHVGTDYFARQAAARTKGEYKALIEGGTFPAPDRLFGEWSDEHWPAGNVLAGCKAEPDRHTYISIDPGIGWPAAAVFQRVERDHPVIGIVVLHVLVGVVTVESKTRPYFLEEIRKEWWPRTYEHLAPPEVTLRLDEAALDPRGGRKRSDDTGFTAEDDIRNPPPGDGSLQPFDTPGLGLQCLYDYGPSPELKVSRVQRAICSGREGVRRFVVSEELHERELAANPTDRGWRHTQLSYKMDKKKGIPKKGGPGDPSGVADAVAEYFSNFAANLHIFEGLRTEDLALEEVGAWSPSSWEPGAFR